MTLTFKKLTSFDTAGTQTESQQETVARYSDIGDSLVKQSSSVICLQGVWSDSAREILVEKLQADYPFLIIKSFGNGPVADSGTCRPLIFIDLIPRSLFR